MKQYWTLLVFCLLLGQVVRLSALELGQRPVFTKRPMDSVILGRLLFYDPILSGNSNISCASCHHPQFGTSDGVSLAIGEGGSGMGRDRRINPDNPPELRIARNAPGLWNLGAEQFTVLFYDGRLETDSLQPNGIRSPLGTDMSTGFQSILAAQAMFPVLSADEMAGHYSENDVSQAIGLGLISYKDGAWDLIVSRILAIPAYAKYFEKIAPREDITFATVANVIADFIAFEWRADNSLFDRAMQEGEQLPVDAQHGMELFYGKARCQTCHSGWLQTDHDFHSIAMPQIGPGKSARFEAHNRDDGRMRVTGDTNNAFAFRTPSLRNVTLTAPYGHDGAYARLEDVVRHHLDPVESLRRYSIEMAVLPYFPDADDMLIMSDPAEVDAIAAANELEPIALNDDEVAAILAFLKALEDPAERLGIPDFVPSGLAIDRLATDAN